MKVVAILGYVQVGMWLLDKTFFSRQQVNVK